MDRKSYSEIWDQEKEKKIINKLCKSICCGLRAYVSLILCVLQCKSMGNGAFGISLLCPISADCQT